MNTRMINHAYCINLDHRTDRWKAAKQQFDAHGLQVERVSAVDGRKGIFGSDQCDNYNNACTLSHMQVIEHAIFHRYKAILVFEDDVLLNPLFERILADAFIDLPENWDLLYLGGNHRQKPLPLTRTLFRATKVFTTHAYIIRSKMFKHMLNEMAKMTQPVDCFFVDAQKIFNCFICNPRIAYQAPGYSDIQHRKVNYSVLHDKRPL